MSARPRVAMRALHNKGPSVAGEANILEKKEKMLPFGTNTLADH